VPADLPTPEQALADSLKAEPAPEAAPKKGPVRIRKAGADAAAPATPPKAEDAPF
jgi:hypothetical protein